MAQGYWPSVSGGGNSAPVTDATTARTLTSADNGKTIRFTSGSAVTVTVPAGLPDGFEAVLVQGGTGVVTAQGDVGVTLEGAVGTSAAFRVLSLFQSGTALYTVVGSGLPSYTFATLPSAALNPFLRARVSDLGNSIWYSNGTVWLPEGGIALIAQGGNLTAPADTALNTLALITIPGGSIGAAGVLVVDQLWCMSGLGSKTTQNVLGATAFYSLAHTTGLVVERRTRIANVGAANVQRSMAANSNNGTGSTTVTFVSGTEDTATDKALTFTAQKATAGDLMLLASYSVSIQRLA